MQCSRLRWARAREPAIGGVWRNVLALILRVCSAHCGAIAKFCCRACSQVAAGMQGPCRGAGILEPLHLPHASTTLVEDEAVSPHTRQFAFTKLGLLRCEQNPFIIFDETSRNGIWRWGWPGDAV